MSSLKRFSSRFLLSFGTLFLMMGVHSFCNPNVPRKERVSDGLDALLLGTYMTAWGGAAVYRLRRQNRQKEQERLRSIFFQTLRQTDGAINVLQFAMAANLSGTDAKQFLEQQAREFAVDCEVNDRGTLLYQFDVGQLPSLTDVDSDANQSSSRLNTFDVVLTDFPDARKMEVIKAVHKLVGLGLWETKDFVEALPKVLKQDISKTEAEAVQRQFEAIGAVVQIAPRRAV